MDDAALTALIRRARSVATKRDGRQDTIAQHIADVLGLSKQQPEAVSQESLAQYRDGTYENGTLYRTVTPGGNLTERDIAHQMISSTDHGLNFGGGRAFGTGLYFAGTGRSGSRGAGAYESSLYGSRGNSYTLEARLKPTARIATSGTMTGTTARQWIRTHRGALTSMGIAVRSNGGVYSTRTGMTSVDAVTTVAMLMGYDGYRNDDSSTPYYTIWNRGALQVARGNKFDRARNNAL